MCTNGEVKIREPLLTFLKTLRNFLNADACILYDLIGNMHPEEKKREFIKRFGNENIKFNNKAYNCKKFDKFSVLKFLGVGEIGEQKRWTLKYSERPDKFIILNDPKSKLFLKEGLTGHSCRTGQLKYYSNLENEECQILRNIENDDTRRGIHPLCDKCLILPLNIKIAKDIVRKVIIRFDIYKNANDEKSNKGFDQEYLKKINEKLIKSSSEIITIKGKELDKSEFYQFLYKSTEVLLDQIDKLAKGNEYSSIYKGSKLITSLTHQRFIRKVNSDIDSLNFRFYEKIIHLFFVLNRRTYIGEEDITDRVVLFAEELWKECNFCIKFSFQDQLKQFRDQEKYILYDLKGYRDHFMHQLHVFVLGYIIINEIGFDFFTKRLSRMFKDIYKKRRNDERQNTQIQKDSVLRIWFLISFFHDINYLLQELSPSISNFIEKLFDNKINFKIDKLNWEMFICGDAQFTDLFHKLCRHFTPVRNKKRGSITQLKLLSQYFSNIIEDQDHGIFSALYLMNKLYLKTQEVEYKDLMREKTPNVKNIEFDIREFEILSAAFAISIHHSIFKKLLIGGRYKINLNEFPMEVLLLLCDDIQEWGRIKKFSSENDVLDFKNFSYESFSYEKNEKTIRICMKYNGNDSYFDLIAKYLDTKKKFIVCGDYSLILEYLFEKGNKRFIDFPRDP